MAFKPYCHQCQSWHIEAEGHMRGTDIPIREPGDNADYAAVGRLKLACELIASVQVDPSKAVEQLRIVISTAKAGLGEEKEVGR